MKNRRKSRELALQVLYARDIWDECDPMRLIDYLALEHKIDDGVVAYSRILVDRTLASRDAIDATLQKHTANWDLRRMAAIDRNILRMSVAELQFCEDVPFKVVIDEAVELAKLYSTEESSRFVNGVLDSSYKSIIKRKDGVVV